MRRSRLSRGPPSGTVPKRRARLDRAATPPVHPSRRVARSSRASRYAAAGSCSARPYAKIEQTIQKVAKEGGYVVVVRAHAPGILYQDPAVPVTDLTDQVIQAYGR